MQIGPYQLSAIETGTVALDGGSMFGVVPKPVWEREHPADEHNRIRLALRALLVEEINGPARILVDTGIGHKWPPALAERFGIDHDQTDLERSLAARGLGTGDITDVLLTHLHFDHAGGATVQRGGDVVPTFENARYWVQERNLDWARDPSPKDRTSYRDENFEPLLAHGVLELLDGPGTWREGFDLIISEGHTTAMQLPKISGDEGALLYCADLIPTASHVRVPWVMGYDNHPLTTIEEKAGLLSAGAEEAWHFFFEHDPSSPAARVHHTDKGYEIAQRISL